MPQHGPLPAEIAIISDYDERPGAGFSRTAAVLSSLGIVSTSCYYTTILEGSLRLDDLEDKISSRKTCPGSGWAYKGENWLSPDVAEGWARVEARLSEVAPKLVIALGKLPLACLTGHTAISKWRGSRLTPNGYPFTVLPTIHPRTLLLQPDQTFIFNLDLKRAYNIYTGKQVPRVYNFLISPTVDEVVERLTELLTRADALRGTPDLLKLSGDLETRQGHIACFGIADSPESAICIPHLVTATENPFYWTPDEEALIVYLYAQLFLHPNILWIGQNYLYDCQYFWRHWGILPRNVRDTMVGHHALHSNIRKGLDFLSSMYAQDHVYWKDEIKEWDPKIGERQYWTYNCKDACITYEIDDEIVKAGKAR